MILFRILLCGWSIYLQHSCNGSPRMVKMIRAVHYMFDQIFWLKMLFRRITECWDFKFMFKKYSALFSQMAQWGFHFSLWVISVLQILYECCSQYKKEEATRGLTSYLIIWINELFSGNWLIIIYPIIKPLDKKTYLMICGPILRVKLEIWR